MTPVKVRKTLLTKSHDPPAAVKWSLAHRWSTRIKEKQKSTGAVVKQRVRTLSLQRCRSLQGCQSLHRCRSFEGCRSFQGSLDPGKVSKLFARTESILFQCKHCSEGVKHKTRPLVYSHRSSLVGSGSGMATSMVSTYSFWRQDEKSALCRRPTCQRW